MNKSEQIIEAAETQVDRSLYVWGARGQDILTKSDPEAWVRSMETANGGYTRDQNVQRVMKRFVKLKAQGISPILCFDCSGFIFWLLNPLGLEKSRYNAAGLYSRCQKKERAELQADDLVFHHNGTKIAHVGLYIGGNLVVHSKGRDYGVVRENINNYKWNRYGKWPGVYDDEPKPTVLYVRANGTVRIRTLPSTLGKKLGTSEDGDTYPYIGTASTGWYEIEYKDQKAYISNKYTTLVGA